MSLLDKPVVSLEALAESLRRKIVDGAGKEQMHRADLEEVESAISYKRSLEHGAGTRRN